MKIPGLLIALSVFSLGAATAQQFENGAFQAGMDGWQVYLPDNAAAKTEIVEGDEAGTKVLKVTLGDAQMEAWSGKLTALLGRLEPGTYTVTFRARVEPADLNVEMSVWATRDGRASRIGDRTSTNLALEWREGFYVFEVKEPEEAVTFSLGGLARTRATFYFTDFQLTRE